MGALVRPGHNRQRSGPDRGFTLIELVMVIVLLGIMAAVGIPVIGSFLASSQETVTRDEMRRLAEAIAGGNSDNDRGFEGDVGYPPSALVDLARKPDTIPAWNPFQHVGWNGPYIDSTNGEYLRDAWGSSYVYTPAARRLESTGSGTTIAITF